MNALELKIPPPVVALVLACAMWGFSLVTPLLEISGPARIAAAVTIAVLGAGFDITAVILFFRRHTTVNPMKPAKTSTLVVTGIYTVTRNPMYVGLVLFLIAWAVYLACAWALVGPVAFVLYINRFQIEPEERMLLKKYGAKYKAYTSNVRRWL
jgi:protein-S-isoprenylcysteine O-methyltransferase Ste14